MFTRRLLFGSMLLLHAAFALLGNAGLHGVLGCHHDHGGQQKCSHDHALAKHSHRGCKHVHASSPADKAHEQPAPIAPPLSEEDCKICQFFARPVETTVGFQWSAGLEHSSSVLVEIDWQPAGIVALPYEVRGPPLVA